MDREGRVEVGVGTVKAGKRGGGDAPVQSQAMMSLTCSSPCLRPSPPPHFPAYIPSWPPPKPSLFALSPLAQKGCRTSCSGPVRHPACSPPTTPWVAQSNPLSPHWSGLGRLESSKTTICFTLPG